ncbi:3-oxoacyl-ACP synthase III family protein [Nocardiopsis coralliicola]
MDTSVGFAGIGHAVGSTAVRNSDIAVSLGRDADWLVERTGVLSRRVCGPGEDVVSLAARAVEHAADNAKVDLRDLGEETLLLHIQSARTHLTPSPGVVLSGQLGLQGVRVLSWEGMGAEPIAAVETAVSLLRSGACERAIVSSAADLVAYVDPQDPATAGLFGAGAAALVLSRDTVGYPEVLIRGMRWETHPQHWRLEEAELHRWQKTTHGIEMAADFYTVREKPLVREADQILPRVVGAALEQAGWELGDVEVLVHHPLNAAMLEAVRTRLGFSSDILTTSLPRQGNLGPAGLIVDLSLAWEAGRLTPGTRLLMASFGAGFSCGAATVEF